MIDDIVAVAEDFPRILTERRSVVVRLDENLLDGDFATTDRHLISINAKIFNDKEYLKREYASMEKIRAFVKGTTYRSVIRHELGHIVANIYNINTMAIAKGVLNVEKTNDIYEYVMDNLSLYAAEYENGVEFISESFSAYYSNIDNYFAREYVNKCKEIAKEEH